MEILDDDFIHKKPIPKASEEVEDSEQQEEEAIQLIPHLNALNNEMPDLVTFLEEQDIYFEVDKITNDKTGIIPLSSATLDNQQNIVYIPSDSVHIVDDWVQQYNANKKDPSPVDMTFSAAEQRTNALFLGIGLIALLAILYSLISHFFNL